jgi:hypothetical protein
MSKDDYAKELLWDQMLQRKNAFLNAMRASDVSLLPRVRAGDRKLKCSHCSFYEKHEDAIPPSPFLLFWVTTVLNYACSKLAKLQELYHPYDPAGSITHIRDVMIEGPAVYKKYRLAIAISRPCLRHKLPSRSRLRGLKPYFDMKGNPHGF